MNDSTKEERSVLREAGKATPDCLSDEELIVVFEADANCDDQRLRHVEECARCESALALMKDFDSARATKDEEASVEWIVNRLRTDLPVQTQAAASEPARSVNGHMRREESFLGKLFRANPFAATAWAGAAAAIVVAGGLWMQRALQPTIQFGPDGGPTVFRSTSIESLSPSGDLNAFPDSFAWSPVEGAIKYKVEVMEVDQSVVWQKEVRSASISAPDQVRAIAVPGKTLLWRVSAVNEAGAAIAVSPVERFRIAVPSSRRAPTTQEA